MFPSFKPFYKCIRDGRMDGRTNLLTYKLPLYIIYLISKLKCAKKPRHFHDFTNALETGGRTDGHTGI